jgi:hypothetical protein
MARNLLSRPIKNNLSCALVAAWEAEIGRIEVESQNEQKVSKTPYQPIAGLGGVCRHTPKLRSGRSELQVV